MQSFDIAAVIEFDSNIVITAVGSDSAIANSSSNAIGSGSTVVAMDSDSSIAAADSNSAATVGSSSSNSAIGSNSSDFAIMGSITTAVESDIAADFIDLVIIEIAAGFTSEHFLNFDFVSSRNFHITTCSHSDSLVADFDHQITLAR